MAKVLPMIKRRAITSLSSSCPDELEISIRDQLTSMNLAERAGFIQTLTLEMKRTGLHIGVYLARLGIPWVGLRDLTLTHAGRLVCFLIITSRGMFVYDPLRRKATKLLDGIDWLYASKWTPQIYRKLNLDAEVRGK